MSTSVWRGRVERYGQHVANRRIRQVWAAVSKTPCAPVRELGQRLGFHYSGVAVALRVLRDAGYVAFESGNAGARARQVLIPFAFIPAEPSPDDGPEQDTDVDGIPQGGK